MWRFLADENFEESIVSGLLLREPALDIVRVVDEGMKGWPDDQILEWAASTSASC